MTNELDTVLDRVIWRQDLQQKLCVSSNTMRLWIKHGKLPRPDVNLSSRTTGWKMSTLRTADINLE